MGSIFVSHSSQDRVAVESVCEWLTTQGFHSLFLDFDPEHGIEAGAKWEEELYSQLRRAAVVLFVGTRAAVASQWCFAELAMARAMGSEIIPVIAGEGGVHPLLVDRQAVDLTGADSSGFERLRRELVAAELDPERDFAWDSTRSPFPGLASFAEGDAAVFFGRHEETERLLAQMRSTSRRYTGRLMAVVGPSGSGKSSLVRAGLLPRLRRVKPPWLVLTVSRPADRPLHQLALCFEKAFRDAGASRTPASIKRTLASGAGGLVSLAEDLSHLQAGDPPPVLVFVDQAEELVAAESGAEHAEFLALLYAATRREGVMWSLLTLRSEFLSAFLQAGNHGFAFDDQLLVGPLDGAQLAEVIERPADRAGLRLGPSLVSRMVADTGGGDALPLLAHTLKELHQLARTRMGAEVTVEDYTRLGGVVGGLRRSADDVVHRLAERDLDRLVLSTLNMLVSVTPDGKPTRRRLARAAFTGQQDEIVDAFIEARLLSSTELEGTSVVEVVHEALLRQWPPLAAEIERTREALQLRSEIERAALDWERSGRHADYLLPGERLAAAERVIDPLQRADDDHARSGERLRADDLQRDFVAASRAAQRAEVDAVRRKNRGLRALAGGLVLLIMLIGVLEVRARRQATEATSLALASSATPLLDTRPDVSLLLAFEGYHAKARVEARSSVLAALTAARDSGLVGFLHGHTDLVRDVAFSPDGRTVATASADKTIRLWDVQTLRQLGAPLTDHANSAFDIAFSPDGRTLASADDDMAVRLWDTRAHTQLGKPLRGHTAALDSVAFSRDGHTLASGSDDKTIRLWDARSHAQLGKPLRGHTDFVRCVAFSPDGRMLASASNDKTLRLWDVRTHERVGKALRGHTSLVRSVAFSPGGRTLVSGSNDKTVRLWSVRTRKQLGKPLRGHTDVVRSVAFSRDGRTLASAGEDKTARLWDAARHQPLGAPLRGHADIVRGVAFSRDGRFLASVSDDMTVRLWDVNAHPRPGAPLRGHSDVVRSLAITDDGSTLASASNDKSIRMWDVHTHEQIRKPLTGHTKAVTTVAFSADSRTMASGSNDRTVRLWDVRTQTLLGTPLVGHTGPVRSVAFSPDGRTLASAANDRTIRLWDVRTQKPIGAPIRGHTDTVRSVAWSRDGHALASASNDETARLWDVRSHKQLGMALTDHTDAVVSVAFAPDGRTLASASNDKTIRLWDVKTREPLGAPLRGHTAFVRSVAFSADGGTLASGGKDKTIRLWDVRTRTPIGVPLRRNTSFVNEVVFSADGRMLASAGNDKTIRLWEKILWRNDAELRSEVCKLVGTGLSTHEWARFAAGIPYRQSCP